MPNKALYPTERLRQCDEPDVRYKAPYCLEATMKIEAQHGAEPQLLPAGQPIRRMGGETRIVNGTDLWLCFQKLCKRHRGDLLSFDAREQASNATQREIAVEGRPGYACEVRPVAERLDVGRVGSNDDATDNIGVAVQILGGGVDDEVGTMRDRPLQRRRQKRVVNRNLGAWNGRFRQWRRCR